MAERYDAGSRIPGKKQNYATSSNASSTPLDIITDRIDGDHRFRIWDIIISVDTAMSVIFRDADGSNTFMKIWLSADAPAQFSPRTGIDCPVNGKGVEILTEASGNIDVTVTYSQVTEKQ